MTLSQMIVFGVKAILAFYVAWFIVMMGIGAAAILVGQLFQ